MVPRMTYTIHKYKRIDIYIKIFKVWPTTFNHYSSNFIITSFQNFKLCQPRTTLRLFHRCPSFSTFFVKTYLSIFALTLSLNSSTDAGKCLSRYKEVQLVNVQSCLANIISIFLFFFFSFVSILK